MKLDVSEKNMHIFKIHIIVVSAIRFSSFFKLYFPLSLILKVQTPKKFSFRKKITFKDNYTEIITDNE